MLKQCSLSQQSLGFIFLFILIDGSIESTCGPPSILRPLPFSLIRNSTTPLTELQQKNAPLNLEKGLFGCGDH